MTLVASGLVVTLMTEQTREAVRSRSMMKYRIVVRRGRTLAFARITTVLKYSMLTRPMEARTRVWNMVSSEYGAYVEHMRCGRLLQRVPVISVLYVKSSER